MICAPEPAPPRRAVGSRRWLPVPLTHGAGSVLGFRVGNLAYCTDVSAIPEASFGLLEGLEVLVLGALSSQPVSAEELREIRTMLDEFERRQG